MNDERPDGRSQGVPPGRHAETFELFWEASAITPTLLPAFAARLEGFTSNKDPRLLTYPSADVRLPAPRDRLAGLMQRRGSVRSFGHGLVSQRQLGALFAAFAANDRGTARSPRPAPSTRWRSSASLGG